MQTVLLLVASVAIAVVAVAFWILVQGILQEMRKIGRASDDLSHFVKTAEEELTSTLHSVRSTTDQANRLMADLAETTGSVRKVVTGIELLIGGAQVGASAARAVKSSTAGLLSVYEGVKQGIKSLRGSKETIEGGISNEQR